jgi:hypothetical protein
VRPNQRLARASAWRLVSVRRFRPPRTCHQLADLWRAVAIQCPATREGWRLIQASMNGAASTASFATCSCGAAQGLARSNSQGVALSTRRRRP